MEEAARKTVSKYRTGHENIDQDSKKVPSESKA
jgi:hypothetical protein